MENGALSANYSRAIFKSPCLSQPLSCQVLLNLPWQYLLHHVPFSLSIFYYCCLHSLKVLVTFPLANIFSSTLVTARDLRIHYSSIISSLCESLIAHVSVPVWLFVYRSLSKHSLITFCKSWGLRLYVYCLFCLFVCLFVYFSLTIKL